MGEIALDALVEAALLLSARALIGAGADMATSQAWVAERLHLVAHIGFDDAFATYFRHVDDEVSAFGSVMATRSIVCVDDVEHDARYDDGARRAMLDAGSRACISVPVIDPKHGDLIGVISAHFRTAGPHDCVGVQQVAELAAALARPATAESEALRRERDGLREALATRADIEQAKGILMATLGCDADEAFEVLVQQSQHENRKVRAVAAEIVGRSRRS